MKTLIEVLGNDWIKYFTRKETIEDLMSRINRGHQKVVGIESIKQVNSDRISVIFSTIKRGHANRGYNLLDVIMNEPTWEQMMDLTFGIRHKCDSRIVIYDQAATMQDKVSNRNTAVKFANIDNDCGVITYILAADVNGNNQSGEIDLQYHIDAGPDSRNITEYRTLPNRKEFEQAEFWLYFDEFPVFIQENMYDLYWWFGDPVKYFINFVIDVIPIWNEKGFYVQLTADNLLGDQTLLKLLRCKRSEVEEQFSDKNIEIHRIPGIPIKITVKWDNRSFMEFRSMGTDEKSNCAERYREVVLDFRDIFEDLIMASGELKQWIFSSKENYEDVLKYHEGPQCNNCSDKEMCFKAAIDDDYYYIIVLIKPCNEANRWFMLAEYLDDFLHAFMMLPEGLLKIEDIEKLIQLGDIIDLDKKMGLTDLDKSKMSAFYSFVSSLHELLSNFDKEEMMREFIVPFMEDQSNLLDERKKLPTVYD